jgi:hypothetical protein
MGVAWMGWVRWDDFTNTMPVMARVESVPSDRPAQFAVTLSRGLSSGLVIFFQFRVSHSLKSAPL